jgi:hypothetical protein
VVDRSATELALDAAHAQGALKALTFARQAIAASTTLDDAKALLDALVDGAAIRSPLTTRIAADAIFDAAATALIGFGGVRHG